MALDREDVRFAPDGLVLRVRQSKGDQEGEGADVGIARGTRPETCPVRAMETWLRRSGIAYGPIFPRLTAAGTNEGRLTGNGVWTILRRLVPPEQVLKHTVHLYRPGTRRPYGVLEWPAMLRQVEAASRNTSYHRYDS